MNFSVIDSTRKSFTFTDIKALLDFAKEESEFWTKKQAELKSIGRTSPYFGYMNIWNQVVQVTTEIEKQSKDWDQETFNRSFNQHTANWTNAMNYNWTWRGQPFIDTWMAVYNLSDNSGNAFFEALAKQNVNNGRDYESLRGYVLAFEFMAQQLPELKKYREGEENAFERLRENLVKKKDTVFGEIYKTQSEINDWITKSKQDVEKWSKNSENIFSTKLSEQKTEFDTKLAAQNNTFESYTAEWKTRKEELEKTYERLLKLKKPAEYWQQRAATLKRQGWLWAAALVVSIALPFFYLRDFFILWLQGQQTSLHLNSIEGAIIFASILSAIAVLIRALSRLTFSSFHLQRDAEEREQLTYLYLALSNEGKVDEKSMSLVLQSLFSRSESGLLSNESGPTMPTLGEVVGAVSKVGRS
jgi:hypothetical protein